MTNENNPIKYNVQCTTTREGDFMVMMMIAYRKYSRYCLSETNQQHDASIYNFIDFSFILHKRFKWIHSFTKYLDIHKEVSGSNVGEILTKSLPKHLRVYLRERIMYTGKVNSIKSTD